ncbi:uncharacterized protein LOC116799102 [Chiroxiphia lanceolata]|uniref:uncharacterized protein LOC116799102 n=1 Tax=Chiroxiphia lanceolata TaxID=296741 RepID=UPI0013CE91CA|nr:uncharacterized protein LOC116799102 [Chiroxiphia lanceolata]
MGMSALGEGKSCPELPLPCAPSELSQMLQAELCVELVLPWKRYCRLPGAWGGNAGVPQSPGCSLVPAPLPQAMSPVLGRAALCPPCPRLGPACVPFRPAGSGVFPVVAADGVSAAGICPAPLQEQLNKTTAATWMIEEENIKAKILWSKLSSQADVSLSPHTPCVTAPSQRTALLQAAFQPDLGIPFTHTLISALACSKPQYFCFLLLFLLLLSSRWLLLSCLAAPTLSWCSSALSPQGSTGSQAVPHGSEQRDREFLPLTLWYADPARKEHLSSGLAGHGDHILLPFSVQSPLPLPQHCAHVGPKSLVCSQSPLALPAACTVRAPSAPTR